MPPERFVTQTKGKKRIVIGQTREEWEYETILKSGQFDVDFYVNEIGLDLSPDEALTHYIKTGERQGHAPSPDFDPAFYAIANPDIKDAGVGWFAHYLQQGRGDGRYPNRSSLKADALELKEFTRGERSVGLGNILYPKGRLAQQLKLDAIEAHLAYGWRDGEILLNDFEDVIYHSLYGFDHTLGMPPIMHYIRIGQRANYLKNRKELEAHREAIGPEFDEGYYEEQDRFNEDIPALDEYCSIGWRRGRNPNRNFDGAFYLDMYPDIRQACISPFYHYMTAGMHEARLPRPVFENLMTPGARDYDSEKKTFLIAIHEASRTGAPLLGLEIGRHLAAQYNVVFIPSRGGELLEALSKHATYVVRPNLGAVHLKYLLKRFEETFDRPVLIANSVETFETANAAAVTSIPTLALLHEFAEYSFPMGKVSRLAMAADLVITPAEMIAASAQSELARIGQFTSNNIRVRVQGKLEELGDTHSEKLGLTIEEIRELVDAGDEQVKIVLGAGFVQTRKGVDLFVQTAREVIRTYGDNVRFIWVGGGYRPDADIFTSVWLKAAVERLELERHVFFFQEQPDLESFYELSDLFYLSSRLDPFPNVAIDSISKGKKIVCFDKATGVAEWIADGRIDGEVVEYLNVTQAAAAITRLLHEPPISQKNLSVGNSEFSMESYITDLVKFSEEACAMKAKILRDADALQDGRLLDHEYFSATVPSDAEEERTNALNYSSLSRKGLVVSNPRPGFNEGKYRADNRLVGRNVNLLLHAAERSIELTTHKCHILSDLKETPHSLRIAVHIHLHYSDLAKEFAARFAEVTPRADLFVTVSSEKARREVEYEFRDHPAGLSVSMVPNRGRDIGPMLEVLRANHGNYDVFGHFHGKKSLFIGGETGQNWRSFLLNTLAGTAGDINKIMALFEHDPALGLIFAEDRLNTGWTKNKPIALTLARELGLSEKLESYPVYPIGTMFWSRPTALLPLINSKVAAENLPSEPLADDATKLHAIERLLPTIIRSQSMTWCTVRKRGVNRRF